MGNKYIFKGIAKDVRKWDGTSKTTGHPYTLTLFTFVHKRPQTKRFRNFYCKSFQADIFNKLQENDTIELTNYYVSIEKFINRAGEEKATLTVYVDEFEYLEIESAYEYEEYRYKTIKHLKPVDDTNKETADVFKYRQMLQQEQTRLNNQDPPPAWENVPVQDVDIEKILEDKDENKKW